MCIRKHLMLLTTLAAAASARAGDLSNVLGATHIDGKYYFGTDEFLSQGADQIVATGSHIVKLQMSGSSSSKYSWNTTWAAERYSTLDELAKTPSVTSVVSNPDINTYVLTSYSISVPGGGAPDEY